MTGKQPASLLAFDVNQTLLDMTPVRQRIGESTDVWFSKLLHASLVANHLDAYRPFDEIGVDVLLAVAAARGDELTREAAEGLVAGMNDLPAHPDVHDAFERLAQRGLDMVVLTNGSTATAHLQMENAGLSPLLRRVISVDEVRRFKPAPETYHHAAGVMKVPVDEMLLVAAHDWDCAGAMAAGAQAAFIKRPGAVWSLPIPPPDYIFDDMAGLADEILSG